MGGWKSQKTVGVRLDPQTAVEAIKIFEDLLIDFNSFLKTRGESPIQPQRPVGSVSYASEDVENRPSKIYGDIDYLVAFPCRKTGDATTQRKAQNEVRKQYTQLWVDFLRQVRPRQVDVEDTVRSSPLLTIVKLPDGRHVQVDLIITYPDYCEWMRGRYTPERHRKGLFMGKLYKALGDVLTLSIGTEGVIARTRDGDLVPSRFRKGVSIETVSTDIENFLVDIAQYLVGSKLQSVHPLLVQNPGVSAKDVTLTGLAKGILGLGHTLAAHGIVESGDSFAKSVAEQYEQLLESELDNPKYQKASTPEQYAMIEKVKGQIESALSDVNSVLRNQVHEALLRRYVALFLAAR